MRQTGCWLAALAQRSGDPDLDWLANRLEAGRRFAAVVRLSAQRLDGDSELLRLEVQAALDDLQAHLGTGYAPVCQTIRHTPKKGSSCYRADYQTWHPGDQTWVSRPTFDVKEVWSECIPNGRMKVAYSTAGSSASTPGKLAFAAGVYSYDGTTSSSLLTNEGFLDAGAVPDSIEKIRAVTRRDRPTCHKVDGPNTALIADALSTFFGMASYLTNQTPRLDGTGVPANARVGVWAVTGDDGKEALLVEYSAGGHPDRPVTDMVYRWFLDPSRGYAITAAGRKLPGRLAHESIAEGYAEVAPGVWLPTKGVAATIVFGEKGEVVSVARRIAIASVLEGVDSGKPVDAALFKPILPTGTAVRDDTE